MAAAKRTKTEQEILDRVGRGEAYYFHYDYRSGIRVLNAAQELKREGLIRLITPQGAMVGEYACTPPNAEWDYKRHELKAAA